MVLFRSLWITIIKWLFEWFSSKTRKRVEGVPKMFRSTPNGGSLSQYNLDEQLENYTPQGTRLFRLSLKVKMKQLDKKRAEDIPAG